MEVKKKCLDLGDLEGDSKDGHEVMEFVVREQLDYATALDCVSNAWNNAKEVYLDNELPETEFLTPLGETLKPSNWGEPSV